MAASVISSKAVVPETYDANFTVQRADNFRLDTDYALGSAPVWHVQVQLDKDKTNEYWFSAEYPNIMLAIRNLPTLGRAQACN